MSAQGGDGQRESRERVGGRAGEAPSLTQAPGVRVWASHQHDPVVRADVSLDEVSDLLADPKALVWIDLTDPQPATLAALQHECRLHDLAMEDALRPHQRPKVDEYAHFYTVVFYAPLQETGVQALHLEQVTLYLGSNFVATVHQRRIDEIEESVRRWRENAEELGLSLSVLLYSLLDSLIDAYFPVVDALGDEIDDIQERIFRQLDRRTLEQLTQVRRTLLHLRRVLAPEREVVNTLLRRDQPILPAETTLYFHDLYDHVVRLIDTIDTYRDLLGTAVDSYLSMTSNTLNEVMKTLTGWSIILMSATLIAGIYGMNFAFMPELRWPFGYPLALGMMLAVGLVLFRYFRRRNWL